MKRLAILFAALISMTGLIPTTAKADSDDMRNYDRDGRVVYVERDRPHMVWVHRHFIRVNGHRVFWVPGHPSVR